MIKRTVKPLEVQPPIDAGIQGWFFPFAVCYRCLCSVVVSTCFMYGKISADIKE